MKDIRVYIAKSHSTVHRACRTILVRQLHFVKRASAIEIWCNKFLYKTWSQQEKFVEKEYRWRFIKTKYSRPFFIVAIIKDQNEPIGCIIVHEFYTSFFIKEEYRRQGIMSFAWAKLVKTYPLDTHVVNLGITQEAIAFRRKHKMPHSYVGMLRDENKRLRRYLLDENKRLRR